MGFPSGSDSKDYAFTAMQETRVWYLGWEDPLEKEIAPHSSILVKRIPWTQEPGRLLSMGLKETELSNYHFHHFSIIHIHRKRKEMIQMNSQNRKILTDLGNLRFPGGKNGVKGLSGSSGWMYTWLYLKCIINKDLLYSTWNSAQWYVAA